MFKFLGTILLIIILRISIPSQEMPEYGDFSEIRGKRTVYILSQDFEARKSMVKQIEEYIRKGKLDAQVVGTVEEAQVIVLYGSAGGSVTFGGYKLHGELVAAIRGREIVNTESGVGGRKYRFRILYTTRQSKGYSAYGISLDKSAHKKAMQKFLDEWSKFQKANPGAVPSATPYILPPFKP
jgi:hypothetical protein